MPDVTDTGLSLGMLLRHLAVNPAAQAQMDALMQRHLLTRQQGLAPPLQAPQGGVYDGLAPPLAYPFGGR